MTALSTIEVDDGMAPVLMMMCKYRLDLVLCVVKVIDAEESC